VEHHGSVEAGDSLVEFPHMIALKQAKGREFRRTLSSEEAPMKTRDKKERASALSFFFNILKPSTL